MGALKKFLHSWLEEHGYELGYDMGNIPDLGDLDAIASDGVDAETYWKKWRKSEEGA